MSDPLATESMHCACIFRRAKDFTHPELVEACAYHSKLADSLSEEIQKRKSLQEAFDATERGRLNAIGDLRIRESQLEDARAQMRAHRQAHQEAQAKLRDRTEYAEKLKDAADERMVTLLMDAAFALSKVQPKNMLAGTLERAAAKLREAHKVVHLSINSTDQRDAASREVAPMNSGPRPDSSLTDSASASHQQAPLGVSRQSPDEYMCPNCVTPWKCNGPHIPESGNSQVNSGDEHGTEVL